MAKRRAQKKPVGIREPGESDVLPGPLPPDCPPGQLGDWLEEQPADLREAAVEFEKLKTKAKDAIAKFDEAAETLNALRRQYNVGRVRIGSSTKFIEFKDMKSTKFKIVTMNKPREVVEAEKSRRDDRAGDIE